MAAFLALLLALALSINSVGQQASTSLASSFGSLLLTDERSQDVVLSIHHDLSDPDTTLPVPGDSTVLGRGDAAAWNVLAVSSLWDSSKVGASVIQTIPVDVVAFNAVNDWSQAQKRPMQQDPLTATANSFLAQGVPIVIKMPAPLSNPLSIGRINQGVGAQLATVRLERNQGSESVLTHFDGVRGHWATAGIAALFRAENARLICSVGRYGERCFTERARDLNIMTHSGGMSLPISVTTGVRAQQSLASVGRTRTGEEVISTLTADARNGTLRLHLGNLQVSRTGLFPAAPVHLRASILPRMEAQG